MQMHIMCKTPSFSLYLYIYIYIYTGTGTCTCTYTHTYIYRSTNMFEKETESRELRMWMLTAVPGVCLTTTAEDILGKLKGILHHTTPYLYEVCCGPDLMAFEFIAGWLGGLGKHEGLWYGLTNLILHFYGNDTAVYTWWLPTTCTMLVNEKHSGSCTTNRSSTDTTAEIQINAVPCLQGAKAAAPRLDLCARLIRVCYIT